MRQVVNVLMKQMEISACKLSSWPIPKGYFKIASTPSPTYAYMPTVTSGANDLFHALKKTNNIGSLVSHN